MFERRGVDIVAMFDIDQNVIGKEYGGARVLDMEELKSFCERTPVDIAVLTLPKSVADDTIPLLEDAGIRGIWNFTGKELKFSDDTVCEDVYLGDSLMTLCYELRTRGNLSKDDTEI